MRFFPRTFTASALTSAAAILILTGTSSAAPAPLTENLDSLGRSNGNSEESTGLIAEVHQIEQNEDGNIISVTWSIENTSTERVVLTWVKDRSYVYSGQNFAGVTALSSDSEVRYHPIMDGEGECLCSGKTSNDFSQRVEAGDQIAYWSMFSVPGDVESVTIEIPGFEPIEDVPIS
ncbi:hypothetical protein [Nocardiopsis sp. CA-288880]|uniref:hypothetical protein n=1 Tax=Nocardiopsis sp. CA-288880 TaxID=3239995 RepID=UPI003D995DA9